MGGRSRSRGRRPPAGRQGRSRPDPEAARRREKELARERSRRRRRRWLIVAGALAFVLLAGALLVFLHRPSGEERALLDRATAAARTAGCDDGRSIRPYPNDRDRTHIGGEDLPSMPPLSSYPSHPPVSGPHGVGTVPAGVYDEPPPLDGVIHSLEHAAVVIWFDPSLSDSPEMDRIRELFARGDQRNHVIVAPYDYPDAGAAGALEDGQVVLAAWHRLRTCAQPDLAVAYDFVSRYRFDLYRFWTYDGDAPERWFTPI